MSVYAKAAILTMALVLGIGCASNWPWIGMSNNNAQHDPFGPNINELTGEEMSPGYGIDR